MKKILVALSLAMAAAFAAAAASVPAPAPAQAPLVAPRVFFTDLDSGPTTGGLNNKGAIVSVYGKGFGATRGSGTVTVGGGAVDNCLSWADGKVVVQLGAAAKTGDVVVATAAGASNGVPFNVRAGSIYFVSPNGTGSGTHASPMSPLSAWNAMAPGRTFYFRGGTYDQGYGSSYGRNFAVGKVHSGTANSPVAFVGYPGEVATLVAPAGQGRQNLALSWDDGAVSNFTLAGFTLKGESGNIAHGGNANAGGEVGNSGAQNVRLVGNIMSANYTGNTMSGMITIGGNGARVYGNELKDTGTTPPINNNHAIYVQLGASDVDIGWNHLHDLKMGHTIQVHTDTAFKYENVRIHDNLMTAANVADSRGINMGNVLPGSTGAIYNNTLSNLGQGFSAIIVGVGTWEVYNNTLSGIWVGSSGLITLWGRDSKAKIRGNILCSAGSPYIVGRSGANLAAQAAIDGNVYCNNGSGPSQDARAVNVDPPFANPAGGDFRLKAGSRAIGRGALQ